MREGSRTREEDPLSQARRAGRDQGLARSLRIDQTTCSMHVGGHTMTVFPLLELPDGVLANVLQRCPPGSIAGFPLPLVLAQVRVTGWVDPHWARPLLHAASKCPAVLDHLSRHLRSVELSQGRTEALKAELSLLPRLEKLSLHAKAQPSLLAALPTSLTKLSLELLDLEEWSPETLSGSLMHLMRLEDLCLGSPSLKEGCAVGATLPRLRRLECWLWFPQDLAILAPRLETLASWIGADSLVRLPTTLTQLKFSRLQDFEGSLSPLTRLTGLQDLTLPGDLDFAEQLPGLLESLTALTRLDIGDDVTGGNLLPLLAALDRSSESLGITLHYLRIDAGTVGLEPLFKRLLVAWLLLVEDPSSLPWAALTRLTRLGLHVDGRKDASWIQPLSRLPGLKELELRIGKQMLSGLGALTQCTTLRLWGIQSIAHLSCLQQLTRLQECDLADSPVECLAALPDSMRRLHVSGMTESADLPLGEALQHLTALEHLAIEWSEGTKDRVCDLSPLRRLTSLLIEDAPCALVRLGSLPCIRVLALHRRAGLDGRMLEQVGSLPSLRELRLDCIVGPEPLTDACLAPLVRLSLLEVLELPRDLGRITANGIRLLLDHLPLLDEPIATELLLHALSLRPAGPN